MFTGIIQQIGTLAGRKTTSAGVSLTVAAPGFAEQLSLGDSVSANGVCQTVESIAGDRFTFTAVGETLRRTTLRDLATRARINLETAATPDTALGGHIVQGHVDGVGVVQSFARQGNDWLLSIKLPQEILGLLVPKGSITIDGVSLTVIEPRPGGIITITVVPFTIDHTIIGKYRKGTKVNVESDILGKYVMEYMARINKKSSA
jgi:riboflavin synthase